MKLLKIFILTITFSLFFISCEELSNDCTCDLPDADWTEKIEVLEQGKSGLLAGYYKDNCSFVVYEEFIETANTNTLVCCIWPPKEKHYNGPFPFPWPGNFPFPLDVWPFSFDPPSGFSDNLKSAISSAPNVIVVDMPLDGSDYNVVNMHIKIGDKSFSGKIDLWKEIYTNQEFYKFMRENDNSQFIYNWLKIPVEFQSRIADATGFSKNSIGRAELPKDCTYGGLMLWESGHTDDPWLSVAAAKEILDGQNNQSSRKFWKFFACLVATAGSDLLSPAATTAVGAANAVILKIDD